MHLSERQKNLTKPDYTKSIYKRNFAPAPELKEYINYRTAARFSESYNESIAYTVTLFMRFLGQNKPLSDVTGEDIDLFVKFMLDREYKTSSIRLYLSHVNGFMQYLKITGRIASIPTRVFPVRMTEKEKLEDVQYLTESDVIAIRQSAARGLRPTQKLWRGIRDRLIIELLISTGMRKSELPTILVENVDLMDMRIKIYGRKNSHTRRSKGKSGWRIVPMTGMSVQYVKEWLAIRPDQNSSELFPELLSRDTDYIVKKICIRAGLKKSDTKTSWVTPHKFRHYFATTLFEKGVDMGIIADMLGDEIKTLDFYIHADRNHDTRYVGSLME